MNLDLRIAEALIASGRGDVAKNIRELLLPISEKLGHRYRPWLRRKSAVAGIKGMHDAYTQQFGDLNDPAVAARHEELAKRWLANSQSAKNRKFQLAAVSKQQVIKKRHKRLQNRSS